MYEKERLDIRLLERKIGEMDAMGCFTQEARNIRAEMALELHNLKSQVPANDPQTLVGPLGGSRGSTNGPFRSFGEFAQAIARAATPGQAVDQRLRDIQAAATGLNETVPSEGGFLLQQNFSTALLGSAFETGILAPRCNRIPISAGANGIKLAGIDETSRVTGSRWGGVQSYWTMEAGEKVKSKPKFRIMELTLQKLIGLCYTTDELLQDATALDVILRQAFAEEIAFMVDDGIVNGTGAGQMLGIMASPCLVTVAKQVGQRADSLVFENILDMYSRMIPRSRKNACWLISPSVEPSLFSMSLSVGTGGVPVYLPASGAAGQPYASLFGRPVLVIEQAAAIGDLGDIIFADLSSYIIVDKGSIQTDYSIHVSFVFDQSVFRCVYRVQGQPAYSSAITPFKGSATLSPFVTLAARA